MKKKAILIAFSNQKGGVGKSAITTLAASYFHYLMDKTVLVVDCDFPQFSIAGMRQRESKMVEKNNTYKNQLETFFQTKQKKAYPIITSAPEKAKETADQFLNNTSTLYDIVFFDLPGTVNSAGIYESILNMDYIFTPILAERMVMQSSISFVATIRDFINYHKDLAIPLKGTYLFWNKINRRVSTETYDYYTEVISLLNLNILSTIIPESERFNKEMSISGKPFFRSTLLNPPKKMMEGTNLEDFFKEVTKIAEL